MATVITGISRTKVISNLDTYNHTALQNSMYVVSMTINELPPSGITITIQQNGVTKASLSAPAAAQSETKLRTILNCAASDLISIIVASSTASDQTINSFKGILKITPGTV